MPEAESVETTAAAETPGAAPAPAAPKKGHLRGRLLRGSIFEIGGYGAQQVIRLGSNLILTRLLFPAAFGLASIVFTVITGLALIAETGFGPCVIQSKRGDDPGFLNTVFTIQVIRGVTLSALMVILAKPIAWFYREPQLENLVYLGSLQLLFTGLHATSVMSLRRHLKFGWNNALDLGQQIINIAIMLLIARRHPVPAALVLGGIIGTFCYGVATHLLPVGYRNRFHWDKEAAKELGKFGRWVVGSSAATFLGGQSDRILLGRFLGAAWLGVYGIALNLTDSICSLVLRVTSGVLYPGLSQAARDPTRNMPSFYYRLRLRIDLLAMSSTGFLAGVGAWLVHALWDARYANAGWIIQILCLRVALTCLIMQPEWCLITHGFTRYSFARSTIRLAANLVFIPIGWHLAGAAGVIWATTLSELPTGLAIWPKAWSLGFFRFRRELIPIAIFVCAFGAGRGLVHLLPPVHLHLHLRH
jgi:O-antigen/teichoic acid export membrane protein